ncbi:MAG: phosphotransferase [Sporichthyaceae bacterium]
MRGDPSAVLRSLTAALGETPALAGTDLVLVGSQARRRSDIYLVGTRADRVPRWVVKVPHPGVAQVDLRPPASAADQLAALRRLNAHLDATSTGFAAPRAVALLPDVAGLAMEFVPGPHLTALIRPRALVAPARLLAGAATAAGVLRALHAVDVAEDVDTSLSELHDGVAARAATALAGAALPTRLLDVPWPVAVPRTAVARRRHVLLHGDFAPENLVFSPGTVHCLDAELAVRGPDEVDVVRFVTMLDDAPMFVAGTGVRAVDRLRARSGATFLQAYYDGAVPVTTWWALIESVASRWAMRHTDCLQRRPRATQVRLSLLRRHFTSLLAELADAARRSERSSPGAGLG